MIEDRKERKERRERKETRIEQWVRTFVGWAFIKEVVHLSDFPELIMGLFLTGGRASEILDLTTRMFVEYDTYYEVVDMPVYKRFDVLDKYIDSEGKRRWVTELVMERRTFPILKSEPFSSDLFNYARKCQGKLYQWNEVKNQYWQLYYRVHKISVPDNPYAPKHLFPHWFRGMRAAQLRCEYGMDIDQIMRFFNWESYDTARHYAGMSSWDLAMVMQERAKIKPRIEQPTVVVWEEPKKEEEIESSPKPKTRLSDDEYEKLKKEVLESEQ